MNAKQNIIAVEKKTISGLKVETHDGCTIMGITYNDRIENKVRA